MTIEAPTRCQYCGLPPHGREWRCDSCLASFTCPNAFLAMPTPTIQVTGHRTRPVIGYENGKRGALEIGLVEVYGDLITCGPVNEVPPDAPKSPLQRALALVETQKRRAELRVVAQEGDSA